MGRQRLKHSNRFHPKQEVNGIERFSVNRNGIEDRKDKGGTKDGKERGIRQDKDEEQNNADKGKVMRHRVKQANGSFHPKHTVHKRGMNFIKFGENVDSLEKDNKVKNKRIQPQYEKRNNPKHGILQLTWRLIKITKQIPILKPKSLNMEKKGLFLSQPFATVEKKQKINVTKEEHLMKRKVKR